jgi:hypothetical protein
MSTAGKALSIALGVKKLLNVERKTHDTTHSYTPSSAAGSIALLNGVSQGDTAYSRDGGSVKMLNVNVKGSLNINGSATTTIVRAMLLYKKDNAGTAPTVADILGSGWTIDSHYAKDNIHRYQVLFDRRYDLDQAAKNQILFNINKPMRLKVRYSGTGTSTSDIEKNGLYFILVSDEATNTPSVVFKGRVTFIDN